MGYIIPMVGMYFVADDGFAVGRCDVAGRLLTVVSIS